MGTKDKDGTSGNPSTPLLPSEGAAVSTILQDVSNVSQSLRTRRILTGPGRY